MGYFLMVIAVSIASVAAYFSVYGLAHIFAATFWSVVIMGGILEVGKLVATSFLYRYWDQLKFALKAYLLVAIFGLMVLTSAGIFGYLSNAYQQDIVGVKDVQARIELLDTELESLVAREQQINEDIGRIGSNYVSARQNLMKQYAPEKEKITKRVADIRVEKLELSTKQLEVEAHTGPIIYIAKAMDRGVDDAVLWMICLIIFVFDPLAVALTIGANIALTADRPEPRQKKRPRPSYLEPEVLDRAKAAGEQRLQARAAQMKSERPDRIVLDHEIMDAVVDSSFAHLDELAALQAAADEAKETVHSLEEELTHKQDMIETLSSDNQRLEDELFALAAAFEKKDAMIGQLKEAIKVLELERQPLTIQERAALHAHNQVTSKTSQ